ncbi:hypothetical protein V6N11_025249 [Hibiscus sabdariffa]|uniref:Uncharacterized protein n=1 Tax=Hibiscus sabdariffa TaxID=183260 RepID=A0ABR2QPJ4_9ROSI
MFSSPKSIRASSTSNGRHVVISYERRFSASLYASNGISKLLKQKLRSEASMAERRSEQLLKFLNACKKKMEDEGKDGVESLWNSLDFHSLLLC